MVSWRECLYIPTMAKNTGKRSQDRFEEIFGKLGKRAYLFRLPDTAEVRGRAGKGWVRDQPSDYIVTEDGDMYYAEVKSTQNRTSFSVTALEKGQRSAAKRQTIAGGKYFVFIHRLLTDDWYKVPAEILFNANKSSMKWRELEPYKWQLAHQS